MSSDRHDSQQEEGFPRPKTRVGLFLDYENIRRSIEHHFSPPPTPQVLCEKLFEMAGKFGHVLMANAYGDWSISTTDPREFRRRQIEPRLVLTKENGDDRTDITLSLDAIETLYRQPELDVYVIVSGDSDFHDLLQRLRRSGKRVVVCGARSDTGRELIRGADRFIALEELMGVRTGRAAQPVEWETYDWSGFIILIRDLDRKLNFVGLRYVATKVLNPHNCGLSDRAQKQELLNRAIDQKIIEPYQVENIEEGGEPVSACRLNTGHDLVREVLSREEGGTTSSPAPEVTIEPEVPETTDAPGEAEVPAPTRSYHSSVNGDDLGRPGENTD
jgi:NYN domain